MSEKFKKIDKEFVLTDESVNVYGFKLRTSGYDMEEYKKIPIGYYDHNDEDGVLVRWEDFRVDGDKVLAKPTINLNHPRGQRTVEEIENGFVTSASVGRLVVLEATTEMLNDEEVPVVTKWYNRECSLVGLPGNRNATIQMFDANEKEIQLSDLLKTEITMPENKLPVAVLAALNLTDANNVDAATAAIKNLADKAAKADQYKTELDQLKANTSKLEVKDLLDKAQEPGKTKITNEMRTKLETNFDTRFGGKVENLKDYLDDLPVIPSVASKIKVEVNKEGAEYKNLADKSYEQMLEGGLADNCKQKFPELFKEKYIEQYGADKWASSPHAAEIDA